MEINIGNNAQRICDLLQSASLRALETCAKAAEEYAKSRCPVDTGALKNSITHAVVPQERAMYVGSDSGYAARVELGAGARSPGGRPYIGPALEEHREEYKAIIIRELEGR